MTAEIAETDSTKRDRIVLIVDDEPNIRTTLALCLEQAGYRSVLAATAQAAAKEAEARRFDLAFVDLRLGAESGLDLVPQLLRRQPGIPIVVITAFATLETAREVMKRGAAAYLPKPFTPAQIRQVIVRIVETERAASLSESSTAAPRWGR